MLTYASKWIPKKDRGEARTFDEAYHATDRDLRGWNKDNKMAGDDIVASDVVVVECYVRRFKNKKLNVGRGWTAWGVNFDLLRVAQLVAGPGGSTPPPPPDSFPEFWCVYNSYAHDQLRSDDTCNRATSFSVFNIYHLTPFS